MYEFELPANLKKEDGSERRVGFEIEFSGVSFSRCAVSIAEAVDGELHQKSPFIYLIETSNYGDFRLEVDAQVLKEQGYQRIWDKLGVSESFQRSLENILSKVATTLIPLELVTPPIPMSQMGIMEQLRHVLFGLGAEGTNSSPFYAFGLHLNVEPPQLDAHTILSYLKAYLLLSTWIKDAGNTDWSRKLTPYIQPFPQSYYQMVLQSDYWPNRDQLFQDYLEHNPTRNRPLDLLPMFSMFYEKQIKSEVTEQKLVNARPCFHYRLPNSLVDQESWRIAHPWERWLKIERLAHSTEKLNQMSNAYQKVLEDTPLLKSKDELWKQELNDWIKLPPNLSLESQGPPAEDSSPGY